MTISTLSISTLAVLLDADPRRDIAVIGRDREPTISRSLLVLGDSDAVQVRDSVEAAGNIGGKGARRRSPSGRSPGWGRR
jgi:S1-C subfamily serine protease